MMYEEYDDYDDHVDDVDAPMFRCLTCGEEYRAKVSEEYQGEYPHGGMMTFLDEDVSPCCQSEGRPIRGEEEGFSFEEDEYSPDDEEVWVVQRRAEASAGGAWFDISWPDKLYVAESMCEDIYRERNDHVPLRINYRESEEGNGDR